MRSRKGFAGVTPDILGCLVLERRIHMPDRLKTHNFFWTWGGGQKIWAQSTVSMRHERNWMDSHTRASVSHKCCWIYLNQNGNHVRHIRIYSDRFSTTTRSIWKTIPSSSRLQARTELVVRPRAKWRPCSNVSGLKYQTSKLNRKLQFQMRLQFQHEQQPLQITTNKESPARHKYTSKHKGTVWTWFLTYTYHKTKCTIQGDTHILERSLPPEFLKTYHLCFVIIRHGLRCMEINNARSRSTSIFFLSLRTSTNRWHRRVFYWCSMHIKLACVHSTSYSDYDV